MRRLLLSEKGRSGKSVVVNAGLAFLKSGVQKQLFNFFFTRIISNKKLGLAFAHDQHFI